MSNKRKCGATNARSKNSKKNLGNRRSNLSLDFCERGDIVFYMKLINFQLIFLTRRRRSIKSNWAYFGTLKNIGEHLVRNNHTRRRVQQWKILEGNLLVSVAGNIVPTKLFMFFYSVYQYPMNGFCMKNILRDVPGFSKNFIFLAYTTLVKSRFF